MALLRRPFVLALMFVFLSPLIAHIPTARAYTQAFSSIYLNPVWSDYGNGSSFVVNVMLNLTSGESLTGFDVRLNYTNPVQTPTVMAYDLNFSGNIFGNDPGNSVLTECVPQGDITNIQCVEYPDFILGWVHFSQLSGTVLHGPVTAGLLFSVRFHVYGKGSSLIHLETANLLNPELVPTTAQDGIFGNLGVNAFFNYLPLDTPTVVAGHVNGFDASGSFNANNTSIGIKSYSWDFGDGTKNNTPIPLIQHVFLSQGQYNVSLAVVDSSGHTASTHRIIAVGPAVGSLHLSVYDASGSGNPEAGVTVHIFNQTSSSPFANQTTDAGGSVLFQNLVPAVYTLIFSGQYVENSSATVKIIAGWTTQDYVSVKVDRPLSPPSSPIPWYGDTVFLASLGGALAIFGFGFVIKRRNIRKKYRDSRTQSKKRL